LITDYRPGECERRTRETGISIFHYAAEDPFRNRRASLSCCYRSIVTAPLRHALLPGPQIQQGKADKQSAEDTQAEDDPMDDVRNAITYFLALKQANVPVEIHLFAHGGHAFGLRPTAMPITHWPSLAEQWLHAIGILSGAPAPNRQQE